MDISEMFANLIYFIIPLIALLLCFLTLRISKKWLKLLAFVFCMVIIFISSVICAFQFEELLHANSRIPSIPSPDGKHIVVVRWFMPGALGDDYVHISLRKKWSPIATEVESGGGEPPNDPTVRWIDSQRLVISYWSKGEIKPCSSSIREVDGVEILCQE